MLAHEHLTLRTQLQQALGRNLVVAASARVSPNGHDCLPIASFSDAIIAGESVRFQPHDDLFALMLELEFLVLICFGNFGKLSLLLVELHRKFFKLLRQSFNLCFGTCHRVFETLELLL